MFSDLDGTILYCVCACVIMGVCKLSLVVFVVESSCSWFFYFEFVI